MLSANRVDFEHFPGGARDLLAADQPGLCQPYFFASFATALTSAACGRRKVDATAAGFLSAFGFFSSRPLPPRPLAMVRTSYGVCFTALLVIA